MKQARAALVLSEKELKRREYLAAAGAISPEAVDRARSTNDQNRHRESQLEADITTARHGSRGDQIAAAEAALKAQEAALERARWELSQKSRFAPQDALVFDTLYREGEWVGAGRPVVALLPPQNIKVRAFVPETRIGAIQIGDSVRVTVDGVPNPFIGKVSYKSPKAEYAPPVIYSREARSKLVFMIEAVFDPKTAQNLHPGQPVDVELTLNHD
jgi:HlyD family secretion protein